MNLTRQEAQVAYRAAWRQRCLSTTPEARQGAEVAMDAVQSACVEGGRPGPEWEAFIDTLPGYRESWATFARWCLNAAKKVFGEGV